MDVNTVPWEKDALDNVKVLHENISVWFGGQIADSVPNAELDGSSQGFSCGLKKLNEEQASDHGKMKQSNTGIYRQSNRHCPEIKSALISTNNKAHGRKLKTRKLRDIVTFRGLVMHLQEDIHLNWENVTIIEFTWTLIMRLQWDFSNTAIKLYLM